MPPTSRKSTHPGEVLQEEFLNPQGMSTEDLAKKTLIPSDFLDRIVRGERPVTVYLAERLAKTFGTTKEFWMNLQTQYDNQRAVEGAKK